MSFRATITEFIMYDVFETCKKVMMFFSKVYSFLRYYQSPLVVTNAKTFCLDSGKSKNIAFEVSSGKPFKYISENSIVQIHFQFCNKPYALAYHRRNPLPFPPYELTEFNKRHRPAIVSMMVGGEDLTEELKPYAGPKQNFYSDKDDFAEVTWQWTHLCIDKGTKVNVLYTDGKMVSLT